MATPHSCRRLALALALAVILTAIVPVTAQAAENPGGWIELLEYTSVQTNGENWFTLAGSSGGFRLPLYGEKRLCKIDMLIWHQTAERITSAKVVSGTTSSTLKVLHVGTGLSRVYGAIPNAYYELLDVRLTHSTTSNVTFELLSCKVTPVATQDMAATGFMYRDDDSTDRVTCPGSYVVDGSGADLTVPWQTPILVTDWQKFDTVTVYGSLAGIGLNSVRCSIGSKGVPYEITYTESNPTGAGETYTETVSISHYETTDRYYGEIRGTHDVNYAYLGKTLFSITIDLTGIDRSLTSELIVYFTGVTYDLHSHAFNCQNLSGSVVTPDTSGVTWWHRFTAFFTDLLGGDSTEADQFKNDMEQAGNDFQNAQNQLDAVTKPNVEDVPLDPGQFLDPAGTQQATFVLGALFENPLVVTLISIALTVAIAAFIIF